MEPAKQEQLAEQTRTWLGKAIEADPKSGGQNQNRDDLFHLQSTPRCCFTARGSGWRSKNEFALYNMGMLGIQSRQYDRAIERLKN